MLWKHRGVTGIQSERFGQVLLLSGALFEKVSFQTVGIKPSETGYLGMLSLPGILLVCKALNANIGTLLLNSFKINLCC